MPAFTSIEEEAAFWHTHDLTDFAEESRPVEITVSTELPERLTLRLDEAVRELLAQQARAKGISRSPLAPRPDVAEEALSTRGCRYHLVSLRRLAFTPSMTRALRNQKHSLPVWPRGVFSQTRSRTGCH